MKRLWAYAYHVASPLAASQLGTIRSLLKEATAAARGGARSWSGRLVLEPGATQILIVSDRPGRDHPLDRRLRDELSRLDAPFTVTAPLAVTNPDEAVTELATSSGNGNGRAGHRDAPPSV